MSKARFLTPVIAIALAASLACVSNASAQAQKKVTYQQAFKLCKDELDKSGAYPVGLNASARATAGAGCMSKYGFRLKKKI
jgi:hypothetical protein